MRVIASIAMITFLLFVPAAGAAENSSPLDRLTQTVTAVSAPVSGVVESATAQLTAPRTSPAPAPPSAAPSPAKGPRVSLETPTGSSEAPASVGPAAADSSGSSADVEDAVSRVGDTASTVPAALDEAARPDRFGAASEAARPPAHAPRRAPRHGLAAFRPAPPRSLLAYIWPAIALDRPQLAAFMNRWEAPALALLAGAVASAPAPANASGGTVAASHQLSASEGEPLRIPTSLPLAPLLDSDPSLPIVIFYVALIAALVAIWVSWRQELGLRIGPRH
jgi:hypothetical protein